jgi:hypothetical protein
MGCNQPIGVDRLSSLRLRLPVVEKGAAREEKGLNDFSREEEHKHEHGEHEDGHGEQGEGDAKVCTKVSCVRFCDEVRGRTLMGFVM